MKVAGVKEVEDMKGMEDMTEVEIMKGMRNGVRKNMLGRF
jgi:hypothetical protein